MSFIERLEMLIKKNHTNQKAVAEYAGLTGSSITLWKKDGTIPRADVAIKIAKLLGVSVEYLVTGENPAKPDTAPVIAKFENALADLKKL